MDESREQHITKLLNSVQSNHPSPDGASTSANTGHWCLSTKYVKDEPPDTWDEEEQLLEGDKEEEEKKTLERKDKDLEFLFHEVQRNGSLDERLKRDLLEKKSEPKYKEMLQFREKLPSYGKKEDLMALINSNRVVVVSGETGCGKTTQVTQFILDDHISRGLGSICRVVCTQPRRISAISVAERVAAERAESVGNGNSCGYQIRLQSRLPRRQGSILYCTTGIILQWLHSDPLLSSISHLVLDEIHERNLQSDVLLIIVKDLLSLRDDLKIILMSATLNAEKFSKYFDRCPMIHIPGFTFPVEEFLLEDVVQMTRYLPQKKEGRPRWKKGFWQGRNFRPEKEEKEAEYLESWPCYARTLKDRYSDDTVQAVEMLDSDEKIDLQLIVSLIRHVVLNEGEGAILVFLPGWDGISSLNDLLMAQQMFRSDRFVIIPLHSLMPTVNQTQVFKRPPPGVRKIVIATNIAETSITIDDVVFVIDGGKIKETHFDTNNNISTMTEEWVSLANAKQRKGRAGRVCPGKCYHLYNEPHIGKLILFGALLGCLDPVLTIAASLSFKDPFFIPLGKEKMADMRRKVLSRNSKSDHLTIINAFQVLQRSSASFLSQSLSCELILYSFITDRSARDGSRQNNAVPDNEKLIKAVIVAGLYPKVATIRPSYSKKRPGVKVYTQADGRVYIHPKSVNAEEREFNYKWLIYHLKMRTSSIFLYDCTEVSPFSLLFFGGDITIQKEEGDETVAVDQWIVFRCPARIAHLVKSLKKELDSLLEEKIQTPAPVDWQNSQSKDCAVISAIIDLITTQEKLAGGSGGYDSAPPPRGQHFYFDDD
ncbi:hypothetical protein fugu_011116 [Takifugu bimaculatus]|uniref:RNA helicase n=1 Tax=Takifugu bimaculatus TaxID=433685 RepID=A0A4Z2CC67_9TELE|nr:hypothetical protein fugu_011116 [Takifugu bimaculatus]